MGSLIFGLVAICGYGAYLGYDYFRPRPVVAKRLKMRVAREFAYIPPRDPRRHSEKALEYIEKRLGCAYEYHRELHPLDVALYECPFFFSQASYVERLVTDVRNLRKDLRTLAAWIKERPAVLCHAANVLYRLQRRRLHRLRQLVGVRLRIVYATV